MDIPRIAKLKIILGEISEYTDIQKDLLFLFKDSILSVDELYNDYHKHYNFFINTETNTLFYNENTAYKYISIKYQIKRYKFEKEIELLLELLCLDTYLLIPIKLD